MRTCLPAACPGQWCPSCYGPLELPACGSEAPTSPPVTGAFAGDRAALIALYNAAGGPGWTGNANWATEAPLGEWQGVRVNEDGRVISLELQGAGLSGPIPPELGSLTDLNVLWLSDGSLSGPIPPELGNLVNLRVLDLGGNRLQGPIPPELANLKGLRVLVLWGNHLVGPVPAWLGSLFQLEFLDLVDTNLSGPIPPELGNLVNLTSLQLGGRNNELTGCIPRQLEDVEGVEHSGLPLC